MHTLPWTVRGLNLVIGALACALFYWWLWTETGPYAWIHAALSTVLGKTAARWTFAAVFLVWVAAILAALAGVNRMAEKLRPGDKAAVDTAGNDFFRGMIVVPVLAFVLAVTGTAQGIIGRRPAAVPLENLATAAGWMPRNVHVDGEIWKARAPQGLIAYASDTSHSVETYLPIAVSGMENPKGYPVYLKSNFGSPEELKAASGPVEGTLAIEPLTARARRELKTSNQPAPMFAIVLQRDYGVLGYWIGILLLHLVPFGIYGLNRLFGRGDGVAANTTPPQVPSTDSRPE